MRQSQEVGAPSGCASRSQAFFYNPNGHHNLLEQLKQHHSPCVDYYLHVPAESYGPSLPGNIAALHLPGPGLGSAGIGK